MSEITYKEKLQSLAWSLKRGTEKKWAVPDDRDGTTAGYQIERWDDSVSAVVTPKPLVMASKAHEGERV